MTYQMTRLRLRSIGHPDSRYRDLTIPLCDADGTPVDSLLWLVNGGGKTSLLSLLFALVVPLRRDFMGADDQERALEEYIQSGDTAHVAIEWVDLDAGNLPGLDATLPRIVTGMVHEWQGRSAPADRAADKAKLTSFYYAFTSLSGGLGLDSLPVEDEGRPRTLKDFGDQLREGGRLGHGAADLETFPGKRNAWADYLEESLGIDPGLYRYQVRMNSAEGAVAQLFRFQSSREFIEFLIDFTAGQSGASSRALDTTTENVRTLLTKLAAKPALAVEHRFSLAAAEKLEEVGRADAERVAAVQRHRSAHERAAVVSASLVAAAETHDRAAEQSTQDAAVLAEALARSEVLRREAESLMAEYALADARLALGDAERAEGSAAASAVEADARAAAWRAVPVLTDLAGVESLIDHLKQRLSVEHEAALPLREQHDEAATRLRTALVRRIEAAAALLIERATGTAGRREELTGLERAESLARVEAGRAEEAAQQRRQGALSARQRASAESSGAEVTGWRADPVAVTTDNLRLAAASADADDGTAAGEAARSAERARYTREQLDELDGRLPGLNADVRSADAAARAARTADEEARDALAAMAAEPTVRELAEAEDEDALDLHSTGEALHARLAGLRQEELAEYAAQTAAATAHRAVLAAVGASGYAPPSGDAAEAIAHLRRAGFEAQAGWQVLRDLLPASPQSVAAALRSEDVATLAAGVIVESEQLQEVISLLAGGALTTSGVVAVADRPALSAALAATAFSADGSVRVPADPALYDRDAARDAYAERERQAEDAADRAADAKHRSDATGVLAARLRAVLTEFPAHECTRRTTEATATAEGLARAELAVQEAETERAELSAALARLTERVEERKAASQRARAARSALLRALGHVEDGEEHEAAAVAHDAENTAAAERADAHSGRVMQLRALIATAESETRSTESALDALRTELDGVHLLGNDPAADPTVEAVASVENDSQAAGSVDLERLRAEYAAIRSEWQTQSTASDVAGRLREAETRLAELRKRLPGEESVLTRAAELLSGPDAATPAAQRTATDLAHQSANTAVAARQQAEDELRQARELVAQLRPRDAEHHASLPDRPQTRAVVQAAGEAASSRATALRELVNVQTEEGRGLEERCRASEQAAEALRERAQRLDVGRRPPDGAELLQMAADRRLVPAFLGQPDAAVVQPVRLHEEENVRRGKELADAEIEVALGAVQAADADDRTVQDRVTAAMSGLTRLGNRAEFKDVPDTIRNRVLAAEVSDLLESAGRLAADLQQRAAMINRQLDDLSQDTEMVVDRLVSSVRQVLDDLAKAERFARMPTGTGTWSERSFLTVRTGSKPDPALVAGRIRPVLERFAANPDALTPMALLKACVLAGAGGPQAFRVKVLKPNAAGQDHEDITKLQKFSGGEKLTVCVALYCVLAKLRAHNAGRDGGSGTLVLDNPLGTASHTDLLSLQRKVAAAHGVQLVYATGVNDLGAVGEFSHRVRLRKTWHAAINRSYVDRVGVEPDAADAAITAAHVGEIDPLRSLLAPTEPRTADEQ